MPLESPAKPLRIIPTSAQASTLSKGQKAFNTLVKKIETLRQEFTQWQAVVEHVHQKMDGHIQPLARQFAEKQIAFLRALDQMQDHKGLTKADKRIAAEVICSLCDSLIQGSINKAEITELKALYNRYSDEDYDAQGEEEMAFMRASLEATFGVELGDEALGESPEEIANQMWEKVQQRQNEWNDQAQANQPPPRKQSAKQKAKAEAEAAALKAESDQTSLSIREVYRKLASALHPDREPDVAERERKTALMQRVNQAYDKKDLLKLLELQLELEHIDEAHIAGLSEDRLKHYNKILKEQVAELEDEINHLQYPLVMMLQAAPYLKLKENQVRTFLARTEMELKSHITAVERDMRVLRDVPSLKAWLKQQQRLAKEAAREEVMEEAMQDALEAAMQEAMWERHGR